MIRLFAIEILKREIELLQKEGKEENKILIAQYEREIIILERVALGNLDVVGKTIEEFEKYMSGKLVVLENEETLEEIDRLSRAFNAFKREYNSHIKEGK